MNLAFCGCAALALHDGTGRIDQLPGGVYKRQVGLWHITLNGSDKPRPKDDGLPEIPPFSAYVEFNGWPAGVIDPGGGILAAGAAANEDTFIAAIEAELGCKIEDVFERQ